MNEDVQGLFANVNLMVTKSIQNMSNIPRIYIARVITPQVDPVEKPSSVLVQLTSSVEQFQTINSSGYSLSAGDTVYVLTSGKNNLTGSFIVGRTGNENIPSEITIEKILDDLGAQNSMIWLRFEETKEEYMAYAELVSEEVENKLQPQITDLDRRLRALGG